MSDLPVPRAPEGWQEFPGDVGRWQQRVLDQIQADTAALKDEFGEFTTIPVPDSQRVILVPGEAGNSEEWFICYLSHAGADARLVVDDYLPDLTEQTENLPDTVE